MSCDAAVPLWAWVGYGLSMLGAAVWLGANMAAVRTGPAPLDVLAMDVGIIVVGVLLGPVTVATCALLSYVGWTEGRTEEDPWRER